MKYVFCVLFFIAITQSVYAAEPEQEYYGYQAASVLIMDADTGRILYETEGFTFRYPASITKVMTALLVLENVENLNEVMTISATAIDLPYYAASMRMQAGEQITVMQALYGNLLPSGNDVARALAEHVSGSVPAFVELMNNRAWELGATNTRFVNPCGLPGHGQFVTAYCVAIIMQEAIRHPVFLQIINTPYFRLPPTNMYEEARFWNNTNRMVRPAEPEFSPYIIGGKTGFTNAAQHTLVSYARRGRHGIIITVLYAQPRGVTFTDTAYLMELGFRILYDNERRAAAAIVAAIFDLAEEERFNAYVEPAAIADVFHAHEEYLSELMGEVVHEITEQLYLYEPEVIAFVHTDIEEYLPPFEIVQFYCLWQDEGSQRNRMLSIVIITTILGLLAAAMYLRQRTSK